MSAMAVMEGGDAGMTTISVTISRSSKGMFIMD